MSLTEMIIELQDVNEKLDRIANDPEYIENRARDIFKSKSYKPDAATIKAIIDDCLA